VALKLGLALGVMSAAVCGSAAGTAAGQGVSLYAQSVRTAVAPATRGLEVLVLDLRTQEWLVDTFQRSDAFQGSDAEIPVGSLVKPFLALAYGRTHRSFPTVVCHGHVDRCWSAGGHGAMGVTEALAHSCNAYFLALARELRVSDIPYLPRPPEGASPAVLVGLVGDWRMAPRALVEGYAAMLAAPGSPAIAQVRAGMRGAAARGTAARVGVHPDGVLAKTGTAPCVDRACVATGDGLVVVAVPAVHPTLVMLVRRRGTTGAMTAENAGRILTRLEALHVE
jgi:cell division protein FtsI/penicillin-binding protein 2